MAVHWEVFLPAVIFAHALGALLLLYSLEKVSGLVSKTWKRLTLPCINGGRTNDADQLGRNSDSASVEVARGAPVELEAAAQKVRATSTWRRGCECTVSARECQGGSYCGPCPQGSADGSMQTVTRDCPRKPFVMEWYGNTL